MSFSHPPGPATVALPLLDEPGERLLWATYLRTFYFDVDGLDARGAPKKGVLHRAARAVGGTAAVFTLDVIFGTSDESPDKPAPPEVLFFGSAPGCLAHQAAGELGESGKTGIRWVWALSTHRFAVLGPAPVEQPEEPREPDDSVLKKAFSLGRGIGKGLREAARILADNRQRYGENIEGEPIATPRYSVRTEFPRERITGVAVTRRRTGRREQPCLRVSLVDGSGVDLLIAATDPDDLERLRALTNGVG
ncbi:hypothetical protein FNH05_16215 [Amycolatopsis rhizosphaerae]|uniref:Uncharacterized protein n=1 Tax=Amycolatopsis rhizosphaerae TaxID=2053003 RepID=A0A558CMV8_9PSEU|nr:hypothetical protein [Amycolatopsis rhizosphaerae]TVT50109.1 hypothetical protein FNH05_16215 [Amycolatopsis rhizosphaerae]